MGKLDDGTITPNYLDFGGDSNGPSQFASSMGDTTLRVGRILAVYEANSKHSRNVGNHEYDVSVRYANGSSGYTDTIYPRVRVSNLFGGTTDFFRWTPRIDNFDDNDQIGRGSRVILLCINGNQQMAYIIGGIPNPEDKTPRLPSSSHHLEFQFNGIYTNIDAEGTFTLIHRGATNVKNEVTSPDGGGGSIQFNTSGDIELGYNWSIPVDNTGIKAVPTPSDGPSDHPYIKLIKENDELHTFAPGDVLHTTKQKFNVDTTGGFIVNHNGSDRQAWVRGTVFREKQKAMHEKMQSAIESLSSALSSAGQDISQAAIKMQAASKMIIVPIAGAVASSVPSTAAALSMTQAGMDLSKAKTALSDLKSAISGFEEGDSSYLSGKHFHSEEP